MVSRVIGFRKLIAGGVVVAMGAILVGKYGDVPPGALQLLQIIFGTFVVGNAIETVVTGVVDGKEVAHTAFDHPQEGAGTSPSEYQGAKLASLEAGVDRVQSAVAQNQEALGFIIQKAFGTPPQQK